MHFVIKVDLQALCKVPNTSSSSLNSKPYQVWGHETWFSEADVCDPVSNAKTSLAHKSCPELPGGFQIGQTVWAVRDLKTVERGNGRKLLVQKYTCGTVEGPSVADSDDETRVSVRWAKLYATGNPGWNNARLDMITGSCPTLPDGLQIGHSVWAARDLVLPATGEVLLHKSMRGTVLGPCTTASKLTRVSVLWEKLATSKEAGTNNARLDMISSPAELDVGHTVMATADMQLEVDWEPEPEGSPDCIAADDKEQEDTEIALEDDCIVCYASRANACLLPCRHTNLCFSCAERLCPGKCPCCRAEIEAITHIQGCD